MSALKIVYICHFSNEEVRSHLKFHIGGFREKILKILRKNIQYADFGVWNPLFLKGFELNDYYECHVIAPLYGLKESRQNFKIRGIDYHIIRCATTSLFRFVKYLSPAYRANPYKQNYKSIQSAVREIKPDVICLCGAENLDYSPSVLGIENIPIITILQTLLNSPKRIKMNVGSEAQRYFERQVIEKSSIIVGSTDNVSVIREINPSVPILPISFPVDVPIKDYNICRNSFCFFSVNLTPNKGIEDVIKAFSYVYKQHPDYVLEIIGGYNKDYKSTLDELARKLEIGDSVIYHGFQKTRKDLFDIAATSSYLVLPGLTSFNSTIREGMLMKKPVITYKLTDIECMANDGEYMLTADYADVSSLAKKMIFAIENDESIHEMVDRAYTYATSHFSAESQSSLLMKYINMAYSNSSFASSN